MATAVISSNYTVLSTCDAVTGWSAGATEPDIKKQGTNSLVTANRNGATVTYTPGTAQDMSAPDTHLRLWFNFSFPGTLETLANGGIRLFVTGGGGTNEYFCAGVDTYEGGWVLLQADLASPDINGGANLASVTACGYKIVPTTAARNIDNTWWDFFVYGTGYDVTGGASGDRVTWDDIAQADTAAGYGLVQRVNGVFFINGKLGLGGASDLYFDGSNEVAVWYDAGESATLYALQGRGAPGSTTDILMNNTVLKSAGQPFLLDMAGVDVDAVSLAGVTVASARNAYFKAGQALTQITFSGCGQVDTGGATATGCVFSGSVDAGGAWLYSDNLTNSDFSNNLYAVEVDTAATYTFTGLTFSGNTTDINNTSGGAVTVNASGGSNPSTFTGAVTINNTVNLTLTGLVAGSEVRILTAGTTTERDGVETSGTTFTYSYNYTANDYVDIVVHNVEYQYLRVSNYLLGTVDSTLPIQQVFDRNYSNP